MTVYFLASPTGHIKIGFTDAPDPSARLSHIQVGSPHPLECLTYCPGSQSDERRLHRLLAAHRTSGEWFAAHRDVLSVVAFVQAFRTLDGIEHGSTAPEELAAYITTAGDLKGFDLTRELTLEQARWKLLLSGEVEPFRGPRDRAFLWRDVMREWCSVAPLDDGRFIGKKAPADSVFTDVFWLENATNAAASFSAKAGVEGTARALVNARSTDELVAVWILACAKELYGRGDFLEEDLAKRVPRIRELLTMCREHSDLGYHDRCTSVLPVPVSLPVMCICELDEFVRVCALTRCRVWAHYQIRTYVDSRYRAHQEASQ